MVAEGGKASAPVAAAGAAQSAFAAGGVSRRAFERCALANAGKSGYDVIFRGPNAISQRWEQG
jgi:hypothetical protein